MTSDSTAEEGQFEPLQQLLYSTDEEEEVRV